MRLLPSPRLFLLLATLLFGNTGCATWKQTESAPREPQALIVAVQGCCPGNEQMTVRTAEGELFSGAVRYGDSGPSAAVSTLRSTLGTELRCTVQAPAQGESEPSGSCLAPDGRTLALAHRQKWEKLGTLVLLPELPDGDCCTGTDWQPGKPCWLGKKAS